VGNSSGGLSECRQSDGTFRHPPEQSKLTSVDATDVSKESRQVAEVCHTDRNWEWPKSAEVVTTYAT
jgi:hypothetical protein